MKEIGRLELLRRYPVKSMKGEDLERAFVAHSGLAGDRVYAFLDPGKKTNFPWVTAREVPELIRFNPRFVEPPGETIRYPDSPAYRVQVETPEGDRRGMEDPDFLRLLEKRWGRPLELRFSEQGMHDALPVSLFSLPTLRRLEAETGLPLDPKRFRANFYVEWANAEPFYEENIIGKILQVGESLRILVAEKDPRCVIINLDPETAAASPEILKTVGREHAGRAGVYAAVVKEGLAAQGDPVFLLDP